MTIFDYVLTILGGILLVVIIIRLIDVVYDFIRRIQ
jgi:tellurite resistance protein TehA-like permease